MQTIIRTLLAILIVSFPTLADEDEDARLRERLSAIAEIESKVMVPMRDGVRLATDIYIPKSGEGPFPAIFWRTPYNFNDLTETRLTFTMLAIQQGYVLVMQNERGKFFSEGEWEILGRPRTDGADALTWIASQSWSNGNVGTIGCSSSAEWQLALAAVDHPAHKAMVPMAAGAGIGRIGEFYEQGNWYRGGVFQMLFATWLYSVQNTQRPELPPDISDADRVRLSRYFDLAPDMPEVDWTAALRHLPLVDLMKHVEGPKGIYSTFITRTPNDPAWYEGGLYHDHEPFGVPALWLNSWYDVSIGPNLALYQHVRKNASDEQVRNNQFMVIAPTVHCGFLQPSPLDTVGARFIGDTSFAYLQQIMAFFDTWLKGDQPQSDTPKVQFYTMGANRWQSSPNWPPDDVQPTTFFLDSDGRANSLFGDGRLVTQASRKDRYDQFSYDPLVPVPSVGGGVCCIGGAVEAGSFDQRPVEARQDVLVYTGPVLKQPLEVTGKIDVTLFVSSSARDTDFTVKLVDVYPDGSAYNLDETIQRVRYRDGYDKQVFMEPGQVYELKMSPLATSNLFKAGHRIRVEVSSSNFPRFARNLNTGGANFDEDTPIVARNGVHHSRKYPSRIVLPVRSTSPHPSQ